MFGLCYLKSALLFIPGRVLGTTTLHTIFTIYQLATRAFDTIHPGGHRQEPLPMFFGAPGLPGFSPDHLRAK